KSRLSLFSIDALWKHSLMVGTLAQRIAKAENAPKNVVDDALMAGLLHDLGQLILAANLPGPYDKVLSTARSNKITLWQAEQEAFGATHTEVGTYLLWLWGLPDPITEAITFHHSPARCPAQGFTPMVAVHVANALAQAEGDRAGGPAADAIDMPYLTKIGLANRLPQWQEIFRETAQSGVSL